MSSGSEESTVTVVSPTENSPDIPASTIFSSSFFITAPAEEFRGSICPFGVEVSARVNVSLPSASSSPFIVTATVFDVSPGENVTVPVADS